MLTGAFLWPVQGGWPGGKGWTGDQGRGKGVCLSIHLSVSHDISRSVLRAGQALREEAPCPGVGVIFAQKDRTGSAG